MFLSLILLNVLGSSVKPCVWGALQVGTKYGDGKRLPLLGTPVAGASAKGEDGMQPVRILDTFAGTTERAGMLIALALDIMPVLLIVLAKADVRKPQASKAALRRAPSMAFSHEHGQRTRHHVCCYRAHPRMPPAGRGAWRPTLT
jgi:hypothetical protein